MCDDDDDEYIETLVMTKIIILVQVKQPIYSTENKHGGLYILPQSFVRQNTTPCEKIATENFKGTKICKHKTVTTCVYANVSDTVRSTDLGSQRITG